MSKNFLERMRTMIANGKEADAKPRESDYLEIPDTAHSSLKHFMDMHTDTIAISRDAGTPHILDAGVQKGYLAGQLLVATPLIDSGCFQKSVVFIFTHNADGAMGVIINQALDLVNFSSLVEGFADNEKTSTMHMPVYYGGPVDRHRGFIIHSSDYIREHTMMRYGGIAMTASNAILRDIAEGKGPKHAHLSIGFAGWSAGQIEQEIEQNSWISVPATADLVFTCANELKWVAASQSLGVDMNFFSTIVGHA